VIRFFSFFPPPPPFSLPPSLARPIFAISFGFNTPWHSRLLVRLSLPFPLLHELDVALASGQETNKKKSLRFFIFLLSLPPFFPLLPVSAKGQTSKIKGAFLAKPGATGGSPPAFLFFSPLFSFLVPEESQKKKKSFKPTYAAQQIAAFTAYPPSSSFFFFFFSFFLLASWLISLLKNTGMVAGFLTAPPLLSFLSPFPPRSTGHRRH